MSERITLTEAMVVRLKRSSRLRFDKARGIHTLLVPERVVVLNESSVMIIEALDGRSIGAILDDFAVKFTAPREVIAADLLKMLQDFTDKGYLDITP
ncbi:pyrroloquinoline quinone biosynthesis peptide chaperone PqqD [Xinfangfangia sp. D13-10-4-6]|uniref:pyrroloquinoline quinone biosynthesis peptide chaperone PqqD n=1 Tax=Pseudogemmobacter hezensis TaxID=2737662 RepID=UPI001557B82D|nr:pyrroloquinoline quinone biosynthesis peptide chaperone PqqD [Pseudogemmobacter hezensis]NPD14824.1 pyrroloquinoline quinone biosynthesis peptide chaperone PqqD [Pseudogemmobacter hezensis]